MADWWDEDVQRLKLEQAQERHNAIVDSVDGDKKKAAKSIDIGASTGADPNVIYHNFDDANRDLRVDLSSGIVTSSQELNNYVLKNPLAATVSKDDWGKLSTFVDALGASPQVLPLRFAVRNIDAFKNIFSEVMQGAGQGMGPQPFGVSDEDIAKFGYTGEQAEWIKAHRYAQGPRSNLIADPFTWWWVADLAMRTAMGGAAGGVAGFLSGSLQELGMDETTARSVGREAYHVATFAQMLGMAGGYPRVTAKIPKPEEMVFGKGPTGKAEGMTPADIRQWNEQVAGRQEAIREFNKILDAAERAEPYLKEGQSPPIGLDPHITKIIAEDAKEEAKTRKNQETTANATETKELSPKLFGDLVDSVVKEEEMGIDWDGVRALYPKGKSPTPGDGLLGDIPGVAEQFAHSLTSGETIVIPKAEWLKADPEVQKLVGDWASSHPIESMSVNEAKNFEGEAKPIPQRPGASRWQNTVDGARRAAGLNPSPTLLKRLQEAATKQVEATIENLNRDFEELKKQQVGAEPEKAKELQGQIDKNREQFTKLRDSLKPKAEAAPEQMELPYLTRQEHIPIFEPGALGPKRLYDKFINAINKLWDEDQRKDLELAKREERRKQTPEWNRNYTEEKEKVAADMQNTRMFRVQNFLRNGVYRGNKGEGMPHIDVESLTPEEQAVIPKRFQAKGGLDPDVIAGSFDYQTGRQLIDDLVAFEEMRQGRQPKEFFNALVDRETLRRMELKHGKFEENVAKAAEEHIIRPTAFDLVHQEYMALGMELGQALSLSKEDIRAQESLAFSRAIASKQSLIKYTRELGKAGREAEAAFLKGDLAEAFRQKEYQVRQMALAELSKKFEKIQESWDRGYKAHSKAEDTSIDQEYSNWLQDLYYKLGLKPKRPWEAIKQNITERGQVSFEKWVEGKNTDLLPIGASEAGIDFNPAIPFAPDLYAPGFAKTMKDLTVAELRMAHNIAQSLIKNGRAEKKVLLDGLERDRQDVLKELMEQLDRTPDKPDIHNPTKWQKRQQQLRVMRVGLMQMEHFWKVADTEDPRGVFTRMFVYPLFRAGNEHRKMERLFSRRLRALEKWNIDYSEKIPNDIFYNPLDFKKDEETGKQEVPPNARLTDMNRENLLTVALNWGNESNKDILTRGHMVKEEDVQAWLDKHMVKEHWDFVRAVGDIFTDIQKMEDKMTLGMNNTIVDKIQIGKVRTAFGDVDGWYWPAKYDRIRGGGPVERLPENPPYVRIQTPNGWTNARTGYAGPLDLHMQQISDHVSRRLKHIAFHPIITEMAKLMLDKEFVKAINKKFGPHYSDLFKPYLKDLAGQHGEMAPTSQSANSLGQGLLINTISTLIGWNPGTVAKHSTTAFAQSWREVGSKNFLLAMRDIWRADRETGQANRDFIMKGGRIGNLDWGGSTEIQGRRQHWEETLGTVVDILFGEGKMDKARRRSIETGAAPIGIIDQWISQVTWLAKYREVNAENLGPKKMSLEEAHMDAVDLADRAVRNTHGSTMIAARPAYMRSPTAWAKSATALYGFFNHIFNRWLTMGPRTMEAARKFKRGEPIGKDVADLTKDVAFYLIFPTFVEQLIDPICGHKDNFGTCSAKLVLQGALAPVPVIRGISHAVISGHDPSEGIFPTSMKSITDLVRDMKHPFDKHHVGDTAKHALTLASIATGVGNEAAAKWAKYAINLALEQDHLPRDPGEAWRALRYGTTKKPKGE